MIFLNFSKYGMKYWDDFERRAGETVDCLRNDKFPTIRRLSIHITNGCNFRCSYCNEHHNTLIMPFEIYSKILYDYSDIGGGIVHITGGEPSTIKDLPNYLFEIVKHPTINFHMNTNFYWNIIPDDMFSLIKRLKVSLDTSNPKYFNQTCHMKDAFEKVTNNLDHLNRLIGNKITDTIVSLTYTVTKQNFRDIISFLDMYYERWPHFYAVFFSSYKGTNPEFVLNNDDIHELFEEVIPQMNEITDQQNDNDTKMLFEMSHGRETFIQGERFPDNKKVPCYLCLSELCIDEVGDIWNCSHLFRDKVPSTGLNIMDGHLKDLSTTAKRGITIPVHKKCLYGCNKKLVTYNIYVHEKLKNLAKNNLS